jgi:uncharacterized protein (DUF39 family)
VASLGDGGVVAADVVFGGIGDRGRERAAQGVDKVVVRVAGELEGEVGLLVIHESDVGFVRLAIKG